MHEASDEILIEAGCLPVPENVLRADHLIFVEGYPDNSD
jgi:hypothetical protein